MPTILHAEDLPQWYCSYCDRDFYGVDKVCPVCASTGTPVKERSQEKESDKE